MNRRAAVVSLGAGLGLIALAQLAAPFGSPPLYDGVVVQEPYRYLSPGPGQLGSPTSYRSTLPVTGIASPVFVAATTESPPQAQLIAESGAFVLPPGATFADRVDRASRRYRRAHERHARRQRVSAVGRRPVRGRGADQRDVVADDQPAGSRRCALGVDRPVRSGRLAGRRDGVGRPARDLPRERHHAR